MAGERNDRNKRIGQKLRLLRETHEELLPPPNILKSFIRELQHDIKDEARDLMAEANYEEAFEILCHGIDVRGLLSLDGYSCDTTTDEKLLVLSSECANKLGHYMNAIKDAEEALRINRNSVPAIVELIRARHTLSSFMGYSGLVAFQKFLHDRITDGVREKPEVQDLMRTLGIHLPSTRSRGTTTRGEAGVDMAWIPSHNKDIAKKNKKEKENSPKHKERKKVKEISDGKEPEFPINEWLKDPSLKQGARIRTPHKTKSPRSSSVSAPVVSAKPPQKLTGEGAIPKGRKTKASAATSQGKTSTPEKTTEKSSSPSASPATRANIPSFHRKIKYICGQCFTLPGGSAVVEQRAGSNPPVCAGLGSHAWKQWKMVVVYSDAKKKWCKVRPRRQNLPAHVSPALCRYGDACKRSLDCWFSHFKEEMELWVYMGKHKLKTLEDVMSAGRKPVEANKEKPSLSTATSASTNRPKTQPSPSPQPRHPCTYCSKAYPEPWQLQQHIQTQDHRLKVESDAEKTWKFRSPPWNVVNGKYEECPEEKKGSCSLSDCIRAHSHEELQEWKERHRYRIMKIKKAKDQKLYAFMDGVLEKYNFSTRGEDVIAENLPGIRVECSQDYSLFLLAEGKATDSTHSCVWSFTVKVSEKKTLKRVCLFYDDNRVRFKLSKPANESEAQVCPGNLIVEDDGKTYRIDVIFHSQILGSFNQWVLFDVGTEPYLVRKLQVQVGSQIQHESFNEMIEEQKLKTAEVWSSSNREIVRFAEEDHELLSSEEELLKDYEVPRSLGTDNIEELSRENYREHMHRMLYIEEQECNNKLSKFAAKSQLRCQDRISLETSVGTVAKYALNGSKFGTVDLKKALMDDSETSQIIDRSVNKMMLKFNSSKKIYEATILPEQDELGKQNQDTLYIRLSPTCVEEQNLEKDTEYQVEIQLQLNRLPFCYMHSAVDRLQNMDMVFPPKENPQKLPSPNLGVKPPIEPHQEQVARFIREHEGRRARHRRPGVGPVVVCGPFGTGKTHTLATAVQRTLESRPDSKILICTHSNSAADLYITEHLHKFVENEGKWKMIRVYAKYRDIKTVPEIVRNYTRITDNKIRIPTTKEIKECSVVIATLTTSHRLESTELRGHFTHILIDEAGQALETEVLQPLTLATGDTCVVLAGDHIQMSPKVFSRDARHANFHKSILERLFYRKVGRVLLSSNYRTCQKMLDFISREFYYGDHAKQQLKAVVNHEPHPRSKHPLVFCVVNGEDEKIGMSYVNHYEVCQIVSSAKDLCDYWPEDKWGPMDANSICVVTPYKMQVRQIRFELRKARMQNVAVETVQNVQGKQFRVMIISTVRTRSTLNKDDMTTFMSTIRPANRSGDTFDYGFLSDHRLLNTACTRAQSLLMVVGDPKALCSVGECSKIWQSYLRECEENGTLLPLGTTVEGIRQEMEAAKQRLNPDAPVFKPAESWTSKTSSAVGYPDSRPSPPLKASSSTLPKPDVDPWLREDDTPIPDGIMREIFRQIQQDQSRMERSTENHDEVPEATDDAHDGKIPTKRKRKLPKFRMIEQNDRIVLDIHFNDRSQEVDADTLEDSDSEEGLRNDKHDERKRQLAYRQVSERPEKYKICSFHCEKSGETYAIPLDEGLSGRISITSKRRRGRALNLDEVIVEILDDLDEPDVAENKRKKYYGQVLCVCKRAAKSALMSKVVCKLDEHIDNQMVPVDRTLPKFFVISRDQDGNRKRNPSRASPDFCTVSIYHYNRELQEGSPFLRNVKVSRKDRKNKLFIVQYIKWFANAPYPMGMVTEELPEGDDKEKGLRILKLTHGVREEWKPGIAKEIEEHFPDGWTIPEEEIESRYDARKTTVFTIDPPESQDLDDALSVDTVGDNFQVGVHIADVSYFVSKDTEVDKEAKSRSTSFYPSFGKPINMLPPRFSNELCSLLPGQDKLTFSVFATLNRNGTVIGNVQIVRSVIQSCIKLTYGEVERMIASASDERNNYVTTREKILTLSKLAQERRSRRLRMGRFAFSHDAEEEEAQYPLAHSLVEEMMLLANEAVARFLVLVYPDCSPLRRQLAPSDDNVGDWLNKFGKDCANSLDLQSRRLPTDGRNEAPNDVFVLKEKWDKLYVAVSNPELLQERINKITDLITSDENHPQLAVAKASFFLIQENANYISTGEHPDNTTRKHHTLNMPVYTHFTSPIRRYFDLVVHRMLLAALNDEKAKDRLHESERPYTTAELEVISHHCNNQLINSRSFEKKTRALLCALRLREAPQSFKAFVGGFSDSNLELIFPYRRFLPPMSPLNVLKPTSRPDINEDNTKMELKWRERIFEMHGSTTPKPRLVQLLTLDKEKMVVKVPAAQWQHILAGIQSEDIYVIQNAIIDAYEETQLQEEAKTRRQKQRCYVENQNLPVEEITCETSDASKPSPFVDFKRSFQRGDVIQVQLNASIQKGVLAPSVQLFFLTPKLGLCTEHREDAINSFAKVADHRPPAKFESIKHYQAVWLPILNMVSAFGAVHSDDSCIIHDVDVDWRCIREDAGSPRFSGTFVIKQTFCSDRGFSVRSGGYLCIRYRDLPLAVKTKVNLRMLGNASTDSSQSSKADPGKTTFVAHAVISAVDDIDKWTEDWTKVAHVEVNQHSAPFPEVLLGSRKVPTCTIEFISKANSDSRLESAVQHLDDAEPLIKSICLHQTPTVNNLDPITRTLFEVGSAIKTFNIKGSPFPVPNDSQQEALKLALKQQFTIIQGPPGTGKTVTGAHLTYFFTEVNKQLPDMGRGRPQVLYCGPSNKSVDVVGNYLLRLGISAVRVYNNMIEQQDYPVPGLSGEARKIGTSQEAKMDPGLRFISLHHLIRQKSNRHSQEILDFERRFRCEGYKITLNELDEYKMIIREAEAVELEKYKVVLCTCNEAGSGRIQRHVNAVQCIVDEAGMCNEPETLIPLVGTIKEDDPRRKAVKRDPRQVVLIGDHKQLRPIIQERTAVELGMEISLLEKYAEKAKMLTIQYRMHESICAFPSEIFYKGKLVTAEGVKKRPKRLDIKWPGGRHHPLVFCHHVGAEAKQSVRTEEGNEQSRANPQEVEHVVRMASVMVNRLRVSQESIVVLTQYRLQRAQIEDRLRTTGLENIAVSTVITSQGREWDYVIMSTVRSLPRVEIDEKPSTAWKKRNLGFITDENQINVAITRPKLGLIILGNKHLLRVHDTWKRLLSHYEGKNAVVNAEDFL